MVWEVIVRLWNRAWQIILDAMATCPQLCANIPAWHFSSVQLKKSRNKRRSFFAQSRRRRGAQRKSGTRELIAIFAALTAQLLRK